MLYITHRGYNELAACGELLNIPYGTEMQTIGDFIATKDGKPVCFITSENGKIHFSRHDDGRGLERGALTYNIAYGGRFTDAQIALLESDWGHFLRDTDTILFNNAFFSAGIADLQRLSDALKEVQP